jgi:hypothetical protein
LRAGERIRVCHHSAKTTVAFGLVDRIADFLRHESESLMFSFPDVVDKLDLKQAATVGSSEPAQRQRSGDGNLHYRREAPATSL